MSRKVSINLTGELYKNIMHVHVEVNGKTEDILQLLLMAMKRNDDVHVIVCNSSELFHDPDFAGQLEEKLKN